VYLTDHGHCTHRGEHADQQPGLQDLHRLFCFLLPRRPTARVRWSVVLGEAQGL
jgi:hypothetical protein